MLDTAVHLEKGDYIYLKSESVFLQVTMKVEADTYMFKSADDKERALDIIKSGEDISHTMPISVQILVNENIETINMHVSCSAKVSDVVEELAELTTENKWKLTLIS